MWSPSISPGSTRCSTSAIVETARRRHHRIEVARRLPVDEVAFGVALPGVNQGDVGDEASLHHIGLVVEVADFLALGDHRADAGAGEEGGDPRAPGADALGERALRIEFELELARKIEIGEDLVLADVARDHLPDLAGFEQDSKADPVDAGVVGDEGQILRARFAHRLDQRLGDAAKAKSARHQDHAVLDLAGERLVGVGVDFSHGMKSSSRKGRSVPSRPARAPQDDSARADTPAEPPPDRFGLTGSFRRGTRPRTSPARYSL